MKVAVPTPDTSADITPEITVQLGTPVHGTGINGFPTTVSVTSASVKLVEPRVPVAIADSVSVI
jgi:hypothetical protein